MKNWATFDAKVAQLKPIDVVLLIYFTKSHRNTNDL